MSADFDLPPDFEPDEDAPRLMLDLSGYEGPLDLMLDLARREKIDITAISILRLAEQFLDFMAQARALRLEVAGDYLVMAAWLAYLKSRLLLPKTAEDSAPAGEDLAADLAARLEKLAAFRKVGEMLGERLAHTGETFARGLREATLAQPRASWAVELAALVTAYGEFRLGTLKTTYHISARKTLSIPQARALLQRMVGQAAQWCPLSLLLEMLDQEGEQAADPRSATASGFVAALELAREGHITLRQEAPFAPLLLRATPGGGAT